MGFVLVLMCCLSFGVHAKTLELVKNRSTIYIEEKQNWELGKELFGIPFIYFSPQENGQRSNISFTDTGAEVQIDIDSLKKSQDLYQSTRKEWAESVDAKVIQFFPYSVSKNKYGHQVHRIGFEYQNENEDYIETSHYIECRGKILFAKSLRLKLNTKHETDFNDLINSVDCGGQR